MEFEEPRAAACEVELLAHAHQTPRTTFVVGQEEPKANLARRRALGPGRDEVDASPTALVCQSGGVGHH